MAGHHYPNTVCMGGHGRPLRHCHVPYMTHFLFSIIFIHPLPGCISCGKLNILEEQNCRTHTHTHKTAGDERTWEEATTENTCRRNSVKKFPTSERSVDIWNGDKEVVQAKLISAFKYGTGQY